MIVVAWLLTLLATPMAIACGYLLLLTLCSAKRRAPDSRRARTRFDVIVPAHDEEAGIASTISSLRAIRYPSDLYRVVVVADNCHDRTAEVARRAGATVLVRDDAGHAGKGRALAFAFDRVIAEGRDAAVVIDADTLVSANLLEAFDARLQSGATVIQCDYAVRNPDASWRTLLMAVALGTFHRLRSLGRARLTLSCGLRGNGMCFATALLRDVHHEAFSVVEDLEYGLLLGEAGHRVAYAPEAHVFGEMVTSEGASRSQRRRWEGGRAGMRHHGWALLWAALRTWDGVLLDLAVDVLLPPLSTLVLVVALGTLGSGVVAAIGAGGASMAALTMWAFCLGCLSIYLIRGWRLSGTGLRGMLSLLHIPGYVMWKLMLIVRRDPGQGVWVRTAREGGPPSS